MTAVAVATTAGLAASGFARVCAAALARTAVPRLGRFDIMADIVLLLVAGGAGFPAK